MREVWLKADEEIPWEEKKEKVTSALESGIDCIIVRGEEIEKVRQLGKIKVASKVNGELGADIVILSPEEIGVNVSAEIAVMMRIRSAEDQLRAEEISKYVDYLIVSTQDWKIIPLENLIASLQTHGGKLIVVVSDEKEAELVTQILERGADGVLITTESRELMKRITDAVKKEIGKVELKEAEIIEVKQIGLGDRVCVDTCTLMNIGEGMLIGSQSDAFFLVHSESEESSYVSARPFRVNAGAVHSYILIGERTKYLSELKAGDEVMIVNVEGEARASWVGRVKIESRPMILVRARSDGREFSVILQNAETIKLVNERGEPVSVTKLRPGDKVLVHLSSGGRHFGKKVEERIIER